MDYMVATDEFSALPPERVRYHPTSQIAAGSYLDSPEYFGRRRL